MNESPIAIVGAGTLGWQIALTFAARGVPVNLHDSNPASLDRAMRTIQAEYLGLVEDGTLPVEAAAAPDLITPRSRLEDAIHHAWLVIEAIPERLELKRQLFAKLAEMTGPHVVLATNSSSFKSRELADVTRDPERLLNTHFYNRPWARPAVELMTCGSTEPLVIERVSTFFAQNGLRPFVCHGESTGFLFNRVWHEIKQESLRVIAEGLTTPAELDELWRIIMGSEPYGPFERMDRVGLDVVLDIERHYAAESGLDHDEPPRLLVDMVERGDLGMKSGKGFYDY